MKFAIVKEQRDFFNRQGQIEFDALINSQQIEEIQGAINFGVAERLGIPAGLLYKSSPLNTYVSSHDMWRTNPFIKKIVTGQKLAEIASELIEYKPLRLGYDQYFPFDKVRYSADAPYTDLFQPPLSLEVRSCLDKVVCGLVICLSGDGATSQEGTIFPTTPGNGTFFLPHRELDFSTLKGNDVYRYLLIVYVEKATHYVHNDKDPQGHFNKQLGYVFGDRLLDKYHPIVYR